MHGRDRQPDGQDALHVRWLREVANHDRDDVRGWHEHGRTAFAKPRGVALPPARAQGRDTRHALRRQGLADRGGPRRQPRVRGDEQAVATQPGAGPGRGLRGADRCRGSRSPRRRPDLRQLQPDGQRGGQGCRGLKRRRHRSRSDRSQVPAADGHGHGDRVGAEDPPRGGRPRSCTVCRPRGRDRGADPGTGVRRP